MAEDPLLEFAPETPQESVERIIQIVPATFLGTAAPAPSRPGGMGSSQKSPVNVSVAAAANLRGEAVGIIRSISATHTLWPRATSLARAVAVHLVSRVSGLSEGLRSRAIGVAASIVREDDAPLRLRGIPHALAIRFAAWQAHIPRIYAVTIVPSLLVFASGIAVGVLVMRLFEVQPLMGVFTGENELASANTTSPRPSGAIPAQPVGFSTQDRPDQLHSPEASAGTLMTAVAAAPKGRPAMNGTAPTARPSAVATRRLAASPLQPRFRGALAIDSIAEGSRVFINGQLAGTTPLFMKDMPAGSRAVRVESPGYRTWSASVQVTANRQTRVIAKLERVVGATH